MLAKVTCCYPQPLYNWHDWALKLGNHPIHSCSLPYKPQSVRLISTFARLTNVLSLPTSVDYTSNCIQFAFGYPVGDSNLVGFNNICFHWMITNEAKVNVHRIGSHHRFSLTVHHQNQYRKGLSSPRRFSALLPDIVNSTPSSPSISQRPDPVCHPAE